MIKSIHLKNFKCFVDSGEIPFSKINLLAGLNGRGKSSMLQSILALAQSVSVDGIPDLQLSGRYYNLGTFEDVLNRGSFAPFQMTIKTDEKEDNVMEFSFEENISSFVSASISGLKVNGFDRVSYEGVYTADGQSVYTSDNKKVLAPTLGTTSDILSLRAFRNLTYISADREGPTNSQRFETFRGVAQSLHPTGDNLLSVMDNMPQEKLDSVQNSLSTIMHGGSLHVEHDEDTITLSLDSNDGGALFKPTNVGYGYGYLLTVLVALELAEKNSVFVIENPEAHLHPGAQTALMNHIISVSKQKGLQVFVETHSDHIINSLLISIKDEIVDRMDVSILFFDKECGSVCIKSLPVNAQGCIHDAPKDFFDEIDKSLEKLVGF